MWEDNDIVEGSVEIRTNAVIARRKPGGDSSSQTVVRIGLNPASEMAVTERILEITGQRGQDQAALRMALHPALAAADLRHRLLHLDPLPRPA